MKANLTKKTLTEALAMLERIVPSHSSNPLLTSLKVEASETALILSGMNLEIDIRVVASAEVTEPKDFIVPAHLFAQIVKSLSGELVELRLKEAELEVRSGGSRFKLQTGDVDAFAPLTFKEENPVMMNAADLSRALNSVRYAAAADAFQAVFRGVKLERNEGSLRAVASDGYRVAVMDVAGGEAGQSIIIPGRNVEELVRVVREGHVSVSTSQGMLTVITDKVKMNLKLLDGDFPDYERVIPKEIKLTATMSASALKEAVNRVAVLADKNANNRVEMLIQDGKLTLSTQGDYGRADDELTITQSGVESAMSIAFNAKHILDALGPIEGDMTLSLSGSTSPAIIAPLNSNYRAVLVALKV